MTESVGRVGKAAATASWQLSKYSRPQLNISMFMSCQRPSKVIGGMHSLHMSVVIRRIEAILSPRPSKEDEVRQMGHRFRQK